MTSIHVLFQHLETIYGAFTVCSESHGPKKPLSPNAQKKTTLLLGMATQTNQQKVSRARNKAFEVVAILD